ncbi:hypothetical protein ACIBO2_44530 [Nonomuraea sp. NPDC050022]|uniref:hypothetical protein n=1 Tax=unclassified Nonomuraea TaxID=2593643 RepID=UPI00340CACFE
MAHEQEAVALMAIPYPIIDEQPLPPAQRSWGFFTRRDTSQLPATPAGAVLVFEVHGGHRAFMERRHLKGSEEAVVEAVSVAVVDVRTRSVHVEVQLPSRDLGYRFIVRANFKCRVTNPETVVADHVQDVAEILAGHLRKDAKLMQLGATRPIEDTHALAPEVAARVQAYLEFYPPTIDGMEVDLAHVELFMPNDVIVHGKSLKKLQWEGESKELLWAIENRDVARIENIFQRGVEAVTALSVSREQLLMGDAVSVAREIQEQRMKSLSDLLRQLPDGALDFLPIDSQRLINQMMKAVTGVEPFIDSSETEERRALGESRHARGEDGPRSIGLEDLDD